MNKGIKKALVVFAATLAVIGAGAFAAEYTQEAKETVQVMSERVLVPGGQSVGIRMNVKGVLVVGLEEIETEDSVVSPGYSAGLQIGDMILSINDTPVYYAKDVSEIVNPASGSANPEPLKLKVLRKEKELDIILKPVKDRDSGENKIGVWVKEKIAGIGTLTFYDPQTNIFAALGHGIYENQTGTLLESGDGQLLRTEVKSVKEGETGKPGEIRGIFYGNEDPIGKVVCNSVYGIYSEADDFRDFQLAQPMVMGWQDQVEEGDAYILTTIEGDKVEKFDIKITKVHPQVKAASKSMEIEVTDQKLLSRCGGIVQGMGVIDNRDNTEKPGNTGFFAVTLSNDPTTGV